MKKLFFILLFLFSTQLRSSELGFSPEGFWESMEWKRDASGFDFQQDKDVKIAEKNFSEFVERYNAQTVCDYNKVPTTFSIPPIIHFIWLGSSPTSQVEQAISSWKNYHPGWQIELWTDEKVSEFSWSEGRLKEIFDQAETYAEKADVLRLDILYQFGGIYSDIDVICLRSFHDLITQDITFFSSFELNYTSRHYGNPFYVGTAVMGSSKGSDVVKYSLDNCKSAAQAPGEGILKRTGPGLISRSCQRNFENPKEKILILPCSYLYPFPWMKRENNPNEFIAPESLAIHLWNYSWKP